MAAYAALVSLMHTIDDLHRHPRPPISLPREEVSSLTAKVAFLQKFLEGYNPHLIYTAEADPFEIRIADAAYAAEETIETQIVDTITKETSSCALYPTLQEAIQEIAAIEKVAMEIKETTGVKYQQQRESTPSSSFVSQEEIVMVGADNLLLELKSKLTADARALQIIPIVGMGGSGKTTLALKVYHDGLIEDHFHIRAWVTISQEYSIQEILIQILTKLIGEPSQGLGEGELGEMLYKHLYNRLYLIIMDDMWSGDAFDGVRDFFPDNGNGSRVVVTTRLSNLASQLSKSEILEMGLLDEADSWILLSRTMFGDIGCCPLELEDIGKKIGKGCKGLPLSIVVVGGFLAKSEQTREFWEYVEGDLNSIVNLDDDERCLKILYMSYKHLPVYLKPCLLYMGVFREDQVIRIPGLIRMWVAEGFLKAISGKILEEVAKECLESLIDRNLVLIDKKGSTGNIKYCRMHDLLRDMCWREAEKEKLYVVLTTPTTRQGITNAAQRRIVISNAMPKNEAVMVVSSTPNARSLICNHRNPILPPRGPRRGKNKKPPPLSLNSRLLRVLHAPEGFDEYVEVVSVESLVNARMLVLNSTPSRYNILWNLQTFCVNQSSGPTTAPIDIWHMPHIRHLYFNNGLHLPEPPNSQEDDDIVWENVHTLKTIFNFKCSKRVVKIIRNIKKLSIYFSEVMLDGDRYCLTNLDCLDKLESLFCDFYVRMDPSGPNSLPKLINFPHSLKKLTLYINPCPCSGEILQKISVLPCLEKLKLFVSAFEESEWITTQGGFRSLKYFHLYGCQGLEVWTSESSHFPSLEHLHLDRINGNIEIPSDFAEIDTLRIVELTYCTAFILSSAKKILEEQEELYGEETFHQVQVLLDHKVEEHDRLASPNFRFTYLPR